MPDVNANVKYHWDRLVRALARQSLMTEAQRADLANDILGAAHVTKEMAAAAAKLKAGTLTEADVVPFAAAVLKGFDAVAHRASLAPKPDVHAAVNDTLARLQAQING